MSFPPTAFFARVSRVPTRVLRAMPLAFSLTFALSTAAFGANVVPLSATQPVLAAVVPSAGQYHWNIDDGNGEPAYSLRLYVQPLPSGDLALTGSLVLDDAELGVYGSGRIRDEKLIFDMTASGGVLQAPMDEGKRQLYPSGKAPALVDSAGFATMRAVLDAKTLEGSMQRYQTNVVTGHHVQGPMYANSVVRRQP